MLNRKLLLLCAFVVLLCGAKTTAYAKTFEESLSQAYQNSASLKAEQAKLRAVDEHVSQAKSGWRPVVEASSEAGKTYQEDRGSVGVPDSTKLTPRDVGITVTQPVFRGFRTVSSVRSAQAAVLAQRAALVDAEQKLFLETGKAYLGVALAQQVLDLNKSNETVLEKQFAATQDRFRVGELKKTDVSQAELRLSAAKASRAVAEGDLANKRSTYLRLVGEMPEFLAMPQFHYELPKSVDDAVALSFKNNPNIQAAMYALESSSADVATTEGSLLPEVSLVGNASRAWNQSTTYTGRHDTASVMAKATIPLYRSGADYSRTREALQIKSQKRQELEDTRQKARDGATSSWQDLHTSRAAIAAHTIETEAATMALEGVKEESKVGTRTTLDVLNAEQELLNAKINLVRSQHDEAVATLQVLASCGSLTLENLHLAVTPYDPEEYYNEVSDKWIGFGSASNQQ
jgi:TolC family type I secretion outer membrane protein